MRTNTCVSTCPNYTKEFKIDRYCLDCRPQYYISGECLDVIVQDNPNNNCLENFVANRVDATITNYACICENPNPYFFPAINAYVNIIINNNIN